MSLRAFAILISISVAPMSADVSVPAFVSVRESETIKAADRRLLGFNNEWAGQLITCGLPSGPGFDSQVVETLKGIPLPLNRVSGLVANVIRWKETVGPYEERVPQALVDWWPEPKKLGLGPIEWIQMIREIDPQARFTWTVNLRESPEDTADLVEFLTGDGKCNPNGGENWAKKRIEYGLLEPVEVDVWELGNELDGPEYRDHFNSIDIYIEACRKHIAAIRSVKPEAALAAHAATFSSLTVYAEFFGGTWEIWHRKVLKEIGADLDYLVFHPYVNSLSSSRLEGDMATIARDIRQITGSDRIKQYISEHAWWPKAEGVLVGSLEWKQTWFTTHALIGCLGTADWLVRMMDSPSARLAAYHCLAGLPWGLINRDEATGRIYRRGIADLFILFNEAYDDATKIVTMSVEGEYTDRTREDGLFTGSALATKRGVNLVLVNRDQVKSRAATFSLENRYTLDSSSILTADSLEDFNTPEQSKISLRTQPGSVELFSSFEVPPKSVVLLKLVRQ